MMETEKLFRDMLGDKFIDPNNLMNGSTKWVLMCQYHEYAWLRQANAPHRQVIAWRPEITPGHITWGQGHYLEGNFDDGDKLFRELSGFNRR